MSETYTNGHEYFKDNAKNVAMQVYHGETIENENKPHTEVDHKNVAIAAENNNTALPQVSSEQVNHSALQIQSL